MNTTLKPIRVVLTDDRPISREAIRDMLARHPVHIIADPENGEQLLQVLSRETPDVVLLDLEMPVMDGSRALDEIQKQYPDTKVIVVSNHYALVLLANYRERGAKG